MTTAAVDPGFTGAIAFLGDSTVEIFDMPIHQVKVGKTVRSMIDIHQLASIFRERKPALVVIEDVGSMPGQGISSAFRFGFGAGIIHGVVAANSLPMRLVTPAKWKRDMGLGSDKDESRQLASRLYPQHAHCWPLKKHDGRAEALLLAHWARVRS